MLKNILLVGMLSLASVAAGADPLTPGGLAGNWVSDTAAMNNSSHIGEHSTLKPRTWITFTSSGDWSMSIVSMGADNKSQTQKSGTYEIHGRQLYLRNHGGGIYQRWDAELSSDGETLQVKYRKGTTAFSKAHRM